MLARCCASRGHLFSIIAQLPQEALFKGRIVLTTAQQAGIIGGRHRPRACKLGSSLDEIQGTACHGGDVLYSGSLSKSYLACCTRLSSFTPAPIIKLKLGHGFVFVRARRCAQTFWASVPSSSYVNSD